MSETCEAPTQGIQEAKSAGGIGRSKTAKHKGLWLGAIVGARRKEHLSCNPNAELLAGYQVKGYSRQRTGGTARLKWPKRLCRA